jgi:hypothetical protein
MLRSASLLCLLGASALFAPALFARQPEGPRAIPLGVQACDTRCQTTETDCDLACDQVAPCVEECKKTSEICAQKCRDAPPPSKPDSSAKPAVPASKKVPAKGTAPAKGAAPKAKPKSD